MQDANSPVLFFDGVCNLCNGAVTFIIKHDKRKELLFASLQSEKGKYVTDKLFSTYGEVPDSLVLQHNEKLYVKSGAALRAAKLMGGAWPLLSVLLIIPRFIRDGVYNWVAKNRYKWFGKRDECMIPTPELKKRFI